MKHKISFLFFVVCILLLVFDQADAQVHGRVIDASSSEDVPYAYIHLEEINRSTTADRNGEFRFQNVPNGSYTISVHRIGYRDYNSTIEVNEDDPEPLEIRLKPESMIGEEVTITGTSERTTGSRLEHASSKIIGDNLRRNLGTTLSETLMNEPGFSERSSGPAPGRPVIRGLGDERVLILQDGERTGDVSAQSSDHAVSLDPMGAEEIEIARGPAALAYGSNAIGGVINVVRNQIPTSVPGQTTGSLSLLGKTVNNEGSAAVDAVVPWKKFAFAFDLNGKTGDDFSTPQGEIENTYLRNSHNTAGLSYIYDNGYLGSSVSYYHFDYGIPPDPNGGHPNGVDIEMRKIQVDIRGERLIRNSFFDLAEARYSFVNYNHVELESNGELGTEFGNLNTNFSAKLHNNNWFIFESGSMGLWGEIQDYAVAGARTPDSNQYSGAAYFIQEGDAGPVHFEVGTRFEHVISRPKQERFSSRIGQIEERSFSALASSASVIYSMNEKFFLGTTALHSFRAPTLEELYSEGPHLAAYSFEIGNPQLDPERGLGLELFLRYRSDRYSGEIAVYNNRFQNYLYAQDTGEQSVSDPALNNFQFVGEEAMFYGLEFSGDAQLTGRLNIGGNLSFTIAERSVSEEEQAITGYDSDNRPLPMIPPLQGSLNLRYNIQKFTITTRFKHTAKQTRLGEFETETEGYRLLDATFQYRFSTNTLLHTLSLSGSNLLNTTYRNHLSRIKEVFPAPGRNFSLLYRVYF